ncbi:MAG: hypothetical protein IJ275_04835 [Ruminococcus sp.]|nr:hypothetical protein [Ruminococcus sp.]
MESKNIEYVLPIERDDVEHVDKRKKRKKISVLSVAVVLVILILCVVLSFVGKKSIEGEWELTVNPEVTQATPDEIEDADRVYYIFEKPNQYGNGKWKICYDGGVEYYEYDLIEKDGEELINLGSVDLTYKFTGSKLLGNAKITLVYPEYTDEQTGQTVQAQEYVLEQAKAPDYEKESYDDYEVDDELIGEWATNERTLAYYYYSIPYSQTVSFTDKGVMTIRYESEDLALDRYMYYAYTAKDNKLTFSMVTDKDTKFTVSYKLDENGNLKFNDDTTQNSIFADAFFGDFTFYTPENLPEPSQATIDEAAITE